MSCRRRWRPSTTRRRPTCRSWWRSTRSTRKARTRQKIRAQLTEYNLVAEEYGGDTMFVDISAKQGTNIEALLEAVAADRRRLAGPAGQPGHGGPGCGDRGAPGPRPRPGGHRAHPARHAAGRRLDRGRRRLRARARAWSTSTARTSRRRCRRGPSRSSASRRCPVPATTCCVVDEDRIARQIADRRSARKRNALAARSRKRISLDDLDAALKETCAAEPDPQGRQLRHRRGAGGGPAGHRDRRRGGTARHRPRCRWRHRDQRQPGVGVERDHHRVQRPRRGQGHRTGQPRGVWTSGTTR